MTTPSIVDPASVLTQALGDASPDLMRTLLQTMINTLLGQVPWSGVTESFQEVIGLRA